jgi:hypothetical protein
MRRENGVAVPDHESPLPWMYEIGMIRASDGSPICDGMLPEDRQYVIHSANYHARLAEIVRRLAEIDDQEWIINRLVRDAAALWLEMQKGGEDA